MILQIGFSFILFNLQICWSYLVLPYNAGYHTPLQIISNASDAGEPLLLTPFIKSKQISKARELSNVEPLIKNIISNAGFFTVNETYNSNLFFWFFRKIGDNWQKAPIILWLQGGPGCSSLYGLFEENGPIMVIKGKVKRRKYPWNKDYNVIYIDQPVGTGFSFTNSSKGYVKNQDEVGAHLYEALTQFFQLYAELKDNALFITGESYAGKYIPAIAYQIHKHKVAGQCNINLKGLFAVSAYSDPINMHQYSEFCSKVGLIDSKIAEKVHHLERNLKSAILSQSWKKATDLWQNILFSLKNNFKNISLYDYTSSLIFGEEAYIEYVQLTQFRKKVHVGCIPYEDFSNKVYENLSCDIMKSVKPLIEELLEHYPIAFIGGELDLIVAYPLVANFLEKLKWSNAFQYHNTPRKKLYDQDRIIGYCRSAGNLSNIFIRKAGHMVPGQQSKVTYHILNKFINGKL